MNYPNPGWQQQPPPGYGYGYPPPPPPRRPSTAPAYLVAAVFLIASLWALVIGILAANGLRNELTGALIGLPFTEDFTGNLDFAISATITVGCVGLLCTVLLFARLGFARWLLVLVGVVVVLTYGYTLVKVFEFGARGSVVVIVAVSMLVWFLATLLVVLPFTGHAMRGYQRRFSGPGTPVHGPGTAGYYPRG